MKLITNYSNGPQLRYAQLSFCKLFQILIGAILTFSLTSSYGDVESPELSEQGCPGCMNGHKPKNTALRFTNDRNGTPAGQLATYPFFPMAGYLGGDLFISNYTDLIAGSGIGDYEGGTATYNGHVGIDSNILTWAQQAAGYPIFAALDGTVTETNDGEPDMNTVWNEQEANYVKIAHENGHVTHYWHMRKDSVTVSVGETVFAGQQIGFVGSSGNSSVPHLHFSTKYGSSHHEPFSGSQRTGSSLWQNQPENRKDTYIRKLVISPTTFADWDDEGLPNPLPHGGTFVASPNPQKIYTWWYLINRPANSSYTLNIIRPNGSTAATASRSYTTVRRRGWAWRSREPIMNTPGTWHVDILYNGELLAHAPFTVVVNANQVSNRPPFDASFRFRKKPFTENDVPVCEVAGYDLIDDPDYDLVKYRYVWKVNGTVRRDVTTGAKSDALARNLISRGDTVRCEVTPTDGNAQAAISIVESVVTETFPDWATRINQITDPSANPDGDSFTNLLEYIHGTSPTEINHLPQVNFSGPVPAWPSIVGSVEPWAQMTVQFSPDLAPNSWQSANFNSLTNMWEAHPGATKRGFFRISASLFPEPIYSILPTGLGTPVP